MVMFYHEELKSSCFKVMKLKSMFGLRKKNVIVFKKKTES